MPHWATPGHALRRRGPVRRLLRALLVVLLFAGAAFVAARLDPLPPRFSGTAQAADGDSLRLQGDRIRLLGIDAPELDQLCTAADGSAWRCGEAARQRLASLVAGTAVSCQPEGQDKYGRTLATCEAGGRDIGAALVAEGLAISSPGYTAEQSRARTARLGIWAGEFVPPRQWRDGDVADEAGSGPLETVWIWFRELTGARTLR
jgi:endonuclease YncB( thermonuclease family)